MAGSKIKTNFIYNMMMTISSYVASLIVYPYVARVLGVENMGILGFVNKTIDSFMLFSLLGISVVGVREIARNKDSQDKDQLSNVFSSLVTILLISTAFVSLVYLVLVTCIGSFNEYKNLFYCGLTRLVFSSLLLDWLFAGLEDFKYISIRTVSLRVIYIIATFVFVKKADDYPLYFIITIVPIILNAIVNWTYAKRFVKFSINLKGIGSYLKQIFTYGGYSILNASFSTFNYIILGILCSKVEVGYYSTADNVYIIFLSVITAFTNVMLPRMSSLLSTNKKEVFDNSIKKSLSAIMMFCVPLAVYGLFFSRQIILVLSGSGYEGAILPLQIMMVLVLLNGINQVFIMQAAMPLGLDGAITVGTAVASVLSLPINYFMMKHFQAVGSAMVLVFSVLFANIYPLYVLFSKKYLSFPKDVFKKYSAQAVMYFLVGLVSFLAMSFVNEFIVFVIASFVFGGVFVFSNRVSLKELIRV